MKHSVCVITGSRAEFGLLHPLLVKLEEEETIDLWLVVTGSHLSQTFGNTQEEIVASGLPIYGRVPIPLEGDSKLDMVKATGAALSAFAAWFAEHCPELLVILGDRYEIFAAATAAALLGIPIAHLHGGETTEGAVDEFLRHSITKMSYLHFAACEEYRRRIIQLGEAPCRVFNVGALGVENICSINPIPLDILQKDIGIGLEKGKYAVVTFHPVTLEDGTAEGQVRELIAAMEMLPELNYIVTLANADAAGRAVNQIWQREADSHSHWAVVPSLGARRYLSLLRDAAMMIGNSSSGIIEGPALGIPTVNIGDRQKGRIMAESILCCAPKRESIIQTMQKALTPKFQRTAKNVMKPFGDGKTSEKILPLIKNFLNDSDINMKKTFFDLTFDISAGV